MKRSSNHSKHWLGACVCLIVWCVLLNLFSSDSFKGGFALAQQENNTMLPELFTCFNVNSSDVSVCSGHGLCTSLNNCTCDEGYHGLNCEGVECFGVRTESNNQTEIAICSGHGQCMSYNYCSCDDGFNGSRCEINSLMDLNNTIDNSTITNSTTSIGINLTSNGTSDSDVGFNNGTLNDTSSSINGQQENNNVTTNNSSSTVDNSTHVDGNSTTIDSASNSTTSQPSNNETTSGNATNPGFVDSASNQTTNSTIGINVDNLNNTSANQSSNSTTQSSNSTNIEDELPFPADNRTIIDPLAGYRVITDRSICIEKLSESHSFLGASVVAKHFNLCDLKTKRYQDNGNAVLTVPTSPLGKYLIKEMNKRIDEILLLQCDHMFNFVFGSKTFIARHGGVYCFDSRYGVLSNPEFVIIGSERVVFQLKGNDIINPKYTYLENASYRNFIMVMMPPSFNFIDGEVGATVINVHDFLAVGEVNSTLTGAIWSRGQPITFTDLTITPPLTFDRYEVVTPTNSYTMCYNTISTSSQVCSGKGKCIDFNTCSCYRGWYGSNCSLSTCVATPTCYNHGCIEDGVCQCFSDSSKGFWTSSNCSTCQDGYYGNMCATRFGSSASISSDFRGLVFNLYLPNAFNKVEFQCSNLIRAIDLQGNLFGSDSLNVKCKYIDRANSIFMITFGSMDYTLQPGTTVQLNSLVHDSISSGTLKEQYISIPVNFMQNVNPPIAVISLPSSLNFGSCEEIPIDGSSSRSIDGKPLKYHWSLIDSQTNNVISKNFATDPFIKLNSSMIAGSYRMALFVQSVFLNQNSSIVYSAIFTKSSQPLPILSVVASVEKLTTEFPVTIKKTVSESACQAESSIITWTQLSGPSIKYQQDEYNNLLITSLDNYGANTYVFKVNAKYPSNPSESVYSQVTLTTKSPDLSLSIVQINVQEKFTTLLVDYTDPESILNTGKTETWKWTSSSSDSGLLALLTSFSTDKLTSITIQSSAFTTVPDSIDLTLKITKSDSRTVEKSTTVYFTNIPPVINILNTGSATESVVLAGDSMPIQTFIPSSQGTNITWSVNGIEQGNTAETTTTIIVDASNLEEGSNNTLVIVATKAGSNRRSITSALTFSTELQFSIAETPKPCDCTVSPLNGVALQTDFDFYCTNCRNVETHIDYKYGFLDDRSGVKIYLNNLEEVFSSKLPLPFSGNSITCFFDIVDTNTGAFTTSTVKVGIQAPTVGKVEDVQSLANTWTSVASSYLQKGDFAKSIYQLASSSRTSSTLLKSAMAKSTSSRLVSSTDCSKGAIENGVCYCQDGFFGDKCDKVVIDFTNIQVAQTNLIENMISITNKTAGNMHPDYISLFSLAADSLLANFEYLESNTVYRSIHSFNSILQNAISNTDFKLSNGIDTLMSIYINSAYNYILERQSILDETKNGGKLLTLIKTVSKLKGRSLYIGKSAKQTMKSTFFSTLIGRNLLNDFPSEIHDTNSNVIVKLDSGFFDMNNLFVGVFKKPFIHVLTSTNDIYSWDRSLKVKKEIGIGTVEYSSVISPIVSFDIADASVTINYSKVTYTIPLTEKIQEKETTSISQTEHSYSCVDFQDGSTELGSSCQLVSISASIATCQCTKQSNIFIRHTVRKTELESAFNLAALIASLVALTFSFILVIVGIVLLCCICRIVRKRKSKKAQVIPSEQELKIKTQQHKTQAPILQ